MGLLSDARLNRRKRRTSFSTRRAVAEVSTSGARLWRFKYSLHGWQKLLALGLYPNVPLTRARQKRGEAPRKFADGLDPAM
jgi:hypothetical protein